MIGGLGFEFSAPLFQEIIHGIALLCNSGCGAARGGNIFCSHEEDESNFEKM